MGLHKVACIFGPDGAGKSTLINFLYALLSSTKGRVLVVKIGTNHMPARIIENLFTMLGYYVWRPNSKCRMQKRIPRWLLKRKCIRFLWSLANFAGSLTAILLYVYIKSFKYGFILVEDFIPRIIADYVYALERHVRNYKPLMSIFLSILLSICPKCIYLSADYETLKARRGSCVEPRDYVEIQIAVYNILIKFLAQQCDSIIINTSKTNKYETLRIALRFMEK